MIDLDELERLCREATPGPWDVLDLTEESIEVLSLASAAEPQCVVARIANVVSKRPIGADDRANAALIAALRNAAPKLIAMARRWQEVERVARQKTEYDVYGRGGFWSVGIHSGDNRMTFAEAVDAMQEQKR